MDQFFINPHQLWNGCHVPNWLLRMPSVSPGAKLCYARLTQYWNDEKEFAWPKMDTLSNELGVCDRQARRYIAELEKAGLIVAKQRGLGQSCEYRFLRCVEIENAIGMSRLTRTYMSDQERTDVSGFPYKDRRQSFEDNQSLLDGSDDFQLESTKVPEKIVDPEETWLEFTATYPKRQGGLSASKGKEAFLKACKSTDPNTILAGVVRYREFCDREEKTGTPFVAQIPTWINGKRWEDDLGGDSGSGAVRRRTGGPKNGGSLEDTLKLVMGL